MTIWRLQHNTRGYCNIELEKESDVRVLDGSKLLSQWTALDVRYHCREDELISNFIYLSGMTVCDLEAKIQIEELVNNYVEFLPLSSRTIVDKQYFLINTITLLDCLDYESSEFTRFKSGNIKGIVKYVMKPDCVKDIPIFKLPLRKRSFPYVNDKFKRVIEENNLTGLTFKKVWEEK